MTIVEEIKKSASMMSEKEIKDYIRGIIIEDVKRYSNRIVGFDFVECDVLEPFATSKADAPIPQYVVTIYLPKTNIVFHEWLSSEGMKWDVINGIYAWRIDNK